MTKAIRKFANIFFVVDGLLILACLLFANTIWLLNTQIAFISSAIVSIATFLSYKNNVAKRLASQEQSIDTLNDRDKVDEIDDPFDLYSEDAPSVEEKELSASEIKAIIKEEKSKVKQNSFKNLFKSTPSFVSIYRLIGYGILIIGFFYLVNNKLFEPFAYLLGLFVVPFSMLVTRLTSKNEFKLEEEGQS